ncbi:hypothetical protein [Agriterribacter humi]|jgi:hypothetical protein|uniref:hypothetical protein n=1 Tax=Agriterribacter humi TaxID=1104781 RepID=UPI001264F09E|nr:hypothetical protein [Agriterribacter humi]
MAKIKKTHKQVEIRPAKKKPEPKVLVDETGEPAISDDDPDTIPSPDEELETRPPYEPPPPAEGP